MSNAMPINGHPTSHPVHSSAHSRDAVPAWHAGFLKLLPAILRHAQIEFQSLLAEARQEAVQEVVVNAMVAYARLVQLGKEEVAYAAPLARFAVAQYRSGRLVSTPLNVRDVTSIQMAGGVRFSVGTGFTDAQREHPPAIGSLITFRYQELSERGVPRFPSFVRVRRDAAGR